MIKETTIVEQIEKQKQKDIIFNTKEQLFKGCSFFISFYRF
jgi:hypothetical protein